MKQLWWAYLHTNGHLQIKRYFDYKDFVDADKSPFVKKRTGTFLANGRDEAEKRAKLLLGVK